MVVTLALGLLAAWGTGCTEVTAPLPAEQIEFESWAVTLQAADPVDTRAEARPGGVHIVGRFDQINPGCYINLDPEARLRGRELELRVTLGMNIGGVRCWARRHMGYEAHVHGLPPGPIQLRVIHIVPNVGSQVVLETELELP
jgi:hypothetical protein